MPTDEAKPRVRNGNIQIQMMFLNYFLEKERTTQIEGLRDFI